MEPTVFTQVVDRLLSAHGYRSIEHLDATLLFPNAQTSGDIVSLTKGIMHHTYEWVLQLTTEFLPDENSDFRIEGDIIHVQGPCAAMIHSNKQSYPETSALKKLMHELAEYKEI